MFFQLKPFCLFVLVQRELDKLVTTVDKLDSGRWTVDGGQKRLPITDHRPKGLPTTDFFCSTHLKEILCYLPYLTTLLTPCAFFDLAFILFMAGLLVF